MSRLLAVQTAAYSIATLLSRGVAVVLLIVLPAFVSPEDYGVLGIVTTVVALAGLIVPLEISHALVRYYPTADPEAKPALVHSAWTFTLAMLSLAAALAWLFSPQLNAALFGAPHLIDAFRLMILLCVATTLFAFVQNQFRWDFRTKDFVVVTIFFAVAALGLSVAFAVTFADPLVGVLLGQLIATAAALLLGAIRQGKTLGLAISRGALKTMLRFSLPLVPASLAIFVSNYASRLVLQDLTNLRDVGIFTWASQLASIPALLLMGFQSSITPYVMKNHADPACPPLLARMLEAVIAIELCLCLGLGLIAPELIALSGYIEYRAAGPLILIIAPAAVMLQLYVFAPGFAVGERTSWQLGVSLVSAAAAIAGNYLLIAAFGTVGAAAAFLLSSAIFFLLWLGLSQRLYPLPLHGARLAAMVAATVALGYYGAGLDGRWLLKLLLVAALALLALLLRLVDVRWLAALRSARATA